MLRLLAVLAVSAGRSRRQAASLFHCAASKVVRAVQRFTYGSFEALRDQRCHNGRHKLSLNYLERLYAVVEVRADEFGWQRPTWTRESLALTLAEQDFPLVAPCTVGRALREIGARRGRPKPTVHCPWPNRRYGSTSAASPTIKIASSAHQPQQRGLRCQLQSDLSRDRCESTRRGRTVAARVERRSDRVDDRESRDRIALEYRAKVLVRRRCTEACFIS